ncbi:hypothetical protein BZG36_01532 [Bifiguratus adelaidae]|uniref:glycogenin glucosyltransferase n=1 Tax=Bifiguratus adelaidae TaxID=1938954 RepID=A0A261Y415_9FUNG|nr:hypothetical protein BZG36_01532 [Bifiguratus adelaidae]
MLGSSFFKGAAALAAVALSLTAKVEAANKVNTGYFPNWLYGNYLPSQIDFTKYTHINYAFALMTNQGGNLPVWADSGVLDPSVQYGLPKLISLAHAAGTKVLVSIGGWSGAQTFSTAFSTASGRTAWVKWNVNFIQQYGTDGVDIDWEYPGRQGAGCNQVNLANDANNFLLLLQELRSTLDSTFGTGAKEITLAVNIQTFDVPSGKMSDVSAFAKVVDRFNIMTYDINGAWNTTSGPNAPFNFQPGHGFASSFVNGIQNWISAGVPASKIAGGLAFYGRSQTLQVTSTPTGQYNPASTVAPAGDSLDGPWTDAYCSSDSSSDSGIWRWSHLRSQGVLTSPTTAASPWIRTVDPVSQTPWLYNPSTKDFISYDDPASISVKVNYAQQQGLAGTFTWSVEEDNGELLAVAAAILSGNTAPTPIGTPSSSGGGSGCSAAPWNSATAYTGGQQVTYNGYVWTAQYWTQGNVPGSSGAPWTQGIACTAEYKEENDDDFDENNNIIDIRGLSDANGQEKSDCKDDDEAGDIELLGRPELGITFTKLQIWKQTQYTKVVYLDADTLPLCNIDDLFEREELSACADAGWPDNFNSGVFVARPSTETFEALVNFASSDGSFDGADQGLLNAFFSNWSTSTSDHRIPFTYNATPNAVYSYRPAFHRYRKNIKVIHFIGADKPWFSPRPTSDAAADDGGYEGMVSKWWKVWRQSFGELAPANVLNYQQYQPSNGPQASNLTFGKFRNAWDVPTIRTPSVSGGVMEVLASNLGRTRLHSPHSRPTKGILRIESSIEKSERSRIKKQVSFENLTTLSVPPAETKRGEHSQPRNHHRTHLHFVEPRQNPQVSSDRLSIDPVISVGDRSSTSTPPPPTAIAHETIQQIQPHPLLSPRSPTPPVHEDLPRPPVYNPDEWGKSNVNPIFPWEIQASKGSAPATRVWQQDSHELAKAAKEKVKKGFRNAWDDLPLRIPHFSPPEQHLPVKEDIGQPVLKGSNRIDSMIREDVSTPLMTDDNDDYGFLPLKHQASSSVWPENPPAEHKAVDMEPTIMSTSVAGTPNRYLDTFLNRKIDSIISVCDADKHQRIKTYKARLHDKNIPTLGEGRNHTGNRAESLTINNGFRNAKKRSNITLKGHVHIDRAIKSGWAARTQTIFVEHKETMSGSPRRSRSAYSTRVAASNKSYAPEPPPSESESSDGESITRCVCGLQPANEGLMVQCDNCEVWQHCDCVGLRAQDIPEHYYCEQCKPEFHSVIKLGHGRTKRQYAEVATKDTSSGKKSPKRRTTMNSRDASLPIPDALAAARYEKAMRENADEIESTSGRSSKRRKKTNDEAIDEEDEEGFVTDEPSRRETRDRKSSQRSESPVTFRPSGRKTNNSLSDPFIPAELPVKRHGRSGSPIVSRDNAFENGQTRQESDSDDEAAETASQSSAKRPRRDAKGGPKRQGSASTDNGAENSRKKANGTVSPVKGEESDDDASMRDDPSAASPLTPAETRKETRIQDDSAESSAVSQAPAPKSKKSSRKNRNNTSSRNNSRTSTPQPSDQHHSHLRSEDDTDRRHDQSRSPPVKIRYPTSRMSIAEMTKRSKQILEYISRLQVEMANKKDLGANSPLKAAQTPVISVEQQDVLTNGTSANVSDAHTTEPPVKQEQETNGGMGHHLQVPPSTNGDVNSPSNGTSSTGTSVELMDKLAREIINFQRKYSPHTAHHHHTSFHHAASPLINSHNAHDVSKMESEAEEDHGGLEREGNMGVAHTTTMKVLVTGASGLLGRAVVRELTHSNIEVIGTAFSRANDELIKLDLRDKDAVAAALEQWKPDAIVHCAAERRPDVAAKDEQGTRELNVECPKVLAELCNAKSIHLLYISTDYVFDGTSPPYDVTDVPNPLNFYGETKLQGEEQVRSHDPAAAILRLPILYGNTEYNAESAVNVLRDAVMDSSKQVDMDHFATRYPTNVEDCARVIKDLIVRKERGTFHFSAEEPYTKYQMCGKYPLQGIRVCSDHSAFPASYRSDGQTSTRSHRPSKPNRDGAGLSCW